MATKTVDKWGMVGYSGTTSFANTRGQATGNVLSNNSTGTNQRYIYTYYFAGSKGSEWTLNRGFFAFDMTTYQTGYTISDLKFYYKPTSSGSGTCKVAIVKSTAQGNADTNLTTADYDSFDDSVAYAATDGSLVWQDSTTLSYFDLNATAVSAITSTGYLKLCILEWTHDYSDNSPFAATNISGWGNGSIGNRFYLSFTATPTGWSAGNINGTTSPQETLNSVAYTSFVGVNGLQ